MSEIERMTDALRRGSELADCTSEGFVLAVTAAYIAGVEAGKLAAHSPVPPAA